MTVGASNFHFLKQWEPQLFRLGALSEAYFSEDPNTSQIKQRQFGEVLAQLSAARFGIQVSAKDAQVDVLRRLKYDSGIPNEVSDLFHTLRLTGNQAVHDLQGDHSSALTGLKIARQLAIWFARTFYEPNRQFGPFIPPRPSSSVSDDAAREVDRLRLELSTSQTEAERLRAQAESAELARRSAAEVAEEAVRDRATWEQLAVETDQARQQLQQRIDAALKFAKSDEAPAPEILAENARDAAEQINLDEADTRTLIDQQLRDAGWEAETLALRYAKGTRPTKGKNRAIAEWPTKSGPADYVLFCGLTLVGTIEAKRQNRNVMAVLRQAERYPRQHRRTESRLMRLLRVWIDGYRNLKNVEIDFDKDSLTTVVIGENGSGKSNLIEAIVEIFRIFDLKLAPPKFRFEIEYLIRGSHVTLSNKDGVVRTRIAAGQSGKFVVPDAVLPDLIFGYYSGSGRKLEKLFDSHQARYYDVINKERSDAEYEAAQIARRLFYCRPIHGVLAVLSCLAKPGINDDATKVLTEKLGITGFHSALAHFKEPSWFNPSSWQKAQAKTGDTGRGRRTYDTLSQQALDIWGARGPAGICMRAFRDTALHPLTMAGKVVDDYRHKLRTEAQLACFLRDARALKSFSDKFDTDQDMFAALEAIDISDLFREMTVWVTRKNDETGDISFSDLSDGERQLLMVLGLIRVSRGKEALFLLDEPDTHLNPAWQLTYLDLIREWTEVAADEDKCQIIMTTHNPLTIAALTKKEVRVMQRGENGQIKVSEPYADPRGLGFTSTLTEIFGLPTTLDPRTQKAIDERNALARIDERSEKQERMLIELNDKLDRLGFMHESRDPLYDEFLKAVHDVKYAERPLMTQDQIEKRRLAMQALIRSLTEGQGKAH